MRSSNKTYVNINDASSRWSEHTPWYWRLVALMASWMVLAGYLILPGLYAKEPQLRISQSVLTVFVVALLTAGYSFTALLCFACRDDRFQADGVFMPALASSTIGLASIAYNFFASRANTWGPAAISGTVVSSAATLLYGILLLLTYRRLAKTKEREGQRVNLYSEQSFYTNYLENVYPTAFRSPSQPPEAPVTEDDRVIQQMALLLRKRSDPHPSPEAISTYRIDLPEDTEQMERQARSQELVGTPAQAHADWSRERANSRPDSLGEHQAWQRWQGRGRTADRTSSTSMQSDRSRNVSREERRREIELGLVHT